MSSDQQSQHWLVGVAERAGLPNAEALTVAGDATIGEAWQQVATVCNVDPEELTQHVGEVFHVPVANLDTAEPASLRLVPASVAEKYGVFPLREDYKHLVIATSNPNDFEVEQAIGFASGRTPVMEVASPAALSAAIEAGYSPDQTVEHLLKNVAPESDDMVRLVDDIEADDLPDTDLGSGPVVSLTNLILRDAVEQLASDIHMQPGAGGGAVRFRVDGVLRHYMQMPLPALHRVVSRIKIMGRLDIADHLMPQDGRAKIGIGNLSIDLRISTVPTRGGEKAVIRLLRPQATGGLEDLGLPPQELEKFRHMLSYRDGIVLVTGPTGSGKTTTLYGALKHLSTDEVNIMTIEDPVEFELPGLTQMQVETKQGVTFASALRAILRQDPDVIFVGEIRDAETAEVAVHASMTGHLVLATLHSNDAISSIQRLADLKLDKSAIVETLRGALAQRLVRRVCANCAEQLDGVELSPDEVRLQHLFRIQPTVRTHGCEGCGHTGFSGRAPLVEAYTMNPQLVSLVLRGVEPAELAEAAIESGMRPLSDAGRELAAAGQTTLSELERVLGESDREMYKPQPQQTTAAEAKTIEVAPTLEPQGESASCRPSQALQPPSELDDESLEGKPFALVVDDDGATRMVVRALLEKEGFGVDEACDGAEALTRFEAGRYYNLMILDLDMPNVGGRKVLQRARSSVATAGLPIIVLTGTKDPDAEIELMDQGADDYVRKPVDPARLLVRVRAMMRRAGI